MSNVQYEGQRRVLRGCKTGGMTLSRQLARQVHIVGEEGVSDPVWKIGMSKSFPNTGRKYHMFEEMKNDHVVGL